MSADWGPLYRDWLVGQRVYLRPMLREDTPLVLRWRSDPAVWRNLFSLLPPTPEGHLAWLERRQQPTDGLSMVVVVRASDEPCGVASLEHIDARSRSAELGILIGEAAQRGQGYGHDACHTLLRFAFDELNLWRIYLRVLADNAPARRLYERLGFQVEGRARDAFFRDGRYHDVLHMGLLRPEWEALSGDRPT